MNTLFARTAFALILIITAPTAMYAAGGQTSTTGASTSSFSTVVVTVPSVIGIDVETDLAIGLSSYLANSAATTNPCPANVFPPPAGCTGGAVYAVNGSTTTAGVPSPPTANSGNVWVAVFSNRGPAGTPPTVSAAVEAAWNSGSPGFPTTDLRVTQSAANNALNVGFGSPTHLTTAGANLPTGTLTGVFNWTRIDQLIDLEVSNASTVTFAAGTFDADVTFTIAK